MINHEAYEEYLESVLHCERMKHLATLAFIDASLEAVVDNVPDEVAEEMDVLRKTIKEGNGND